MAQLDVIDGGKAPRPQSVRERFMQHVVRSPEPDGCWAWRGAKRKSGAGVLCVAKGDGGNVSAARIRFALEWGWLLPWQQLVTVPGCKLGVACVAPHHHRIAARP